MVVGRGRWDDGRETGIHTEQLRHTHTHTLLVALRHLPWDKREGKENIN